MPARLPFVVTRQPSKISGPQFEQMVETLMPVNEAFRFAVEDIAHGFVRLRLRFHERQLRPGGSIAGPVQFTLADTALWAAVLTVAGEVPLAVTSDMSIRFLRKPAPRDLIAECRLLKASGRLMSGAVTLYSADEDAPVAHATGTYAVPRSPRAARGLDEDPRENQG